MEVEPLTPVAPRAVRRSVMSQWWRQVTFVHWAVDAEAVARLLPRGLRPDSLDGVCYVGLVAFRMVDTRLIGAPAVPYLGSFAETNVRLYTVDENGRRGVLFVSMDAARLVPVMVARTTLGLPYRWSRMRVRVESGLASYDCQVRRAGPVSRLAVSVGEPLDESSTLELLLTARWGMHCRAGFLATEHPTWPLHRAALMTCEDHLLSAAGFPGLADDTPASVLYSPGVPVRFGPVAGRRD